MSYDLSYNGPMNRIGVRELNQQTSRVIERVKRGEVLEITDRGQPVARLVPATPPPTSELLERLVREGQVVPPSVVGPFTVPPGDPSIDATSALTELREEERW